VSIIKVRQAIELGLFYITPAIDTAYDNFPYTPSTNTPYQRVTLVPSLPDNTTFGDGHYQERGLLFIELHYPINNGSVTAATRAELIRTTFKRGASFTNGGLTVIIEKTPEIGQGMVQDAFWILPVRCRYYAEVFA